MCWLYPCSMKLSEEITQEVKGSDPKQYIELGNKAGQLGNMEESLMWYMQGLTKAKELKDAMSIQKLSALIALSL